MINLVQTIANLIKGSDQNKLHFFENHGPEQMLKNLTYTHFIENVKFTELAM